MDADGRLPRRLLSAAVRALESRARCARSGRAHRSAQQPLLFLLHRAVAAGGLLLHRSVDRRRRYPVPDEFGRRPRLVRLSLPANRVDRLVLRGGAPDRGRPARAHEEGCRRRSDEARAYFRNRPQTFDLAVDRLVDRRRLGSLLQRRTDAGETARHLPGAHGGLSLDRYSHGHDLSARGLHARAGLHLYVPMAAHPGSPHRRMGAQCHLSLRPGRKAHLGEESGRTARAWRACRRLRRLLSMRRGLSDRHRHPQRSAARMHPMRAVHRCLRQRHEEDRPRDAPDRLRQRHQHSSPRGRQAADLSRGPAAYHRL